MNCDSHDKLEERVRKNETDIVEIKTDMKHLPAQMKDAVEEGLKSHNPSQQPVNGKQKILYNSAMIALIYAIIKVLDAAAAAINSTFGG